MLYFMKQIKLKVLRGLEKQLNNENEHHVHIVSVILLRLQIFTEKITDLVLFFIGCHTNIFDFAMHYHIFSIYFLNFFKNC